VATVIAGVGGPMLPQERRLFTEVPGPRSRALAARRSAAVSTAVSSTMPVYAAAGGGVLVDVDGNSFIDPGSGIAVTTVGNSAPRVVEAVRDQVARFTHTCFMIPVRRLYRGRRGAQRHHSKRPPEALGAVQ
jgi:4-aminobutyrate aminotransferase/(S)-3-amino-2-methylpropionate transaminase